MTASHAYPLPGGYGSAVICAFSVEVVGKYSSVPHRREDATATSARLSDHTLFGGQSGLRSCT